MKISLLTLTLGLNIAFVSPTLAQNTLDSPPIPNPILQAQSQNIETLIQQAVQYTQQGKPQQAIETSKQILKLAQQQQDQEIEALAYLYFGKNYRNIGQPQPALKNYQQALSRKVQLNIRWSSCIMSKQCQPL